MRRLRAAKGVCLMRRTRRRAFAAVWLLSFLTVLALGLGLPGGLHRAVAHGGTFAHAGHDHHHHAHHGTGADEQDPDSDSPSDDDCPTCHLIAGLTALPIAAPQALLVLGVQRLEPLPDVAVNACQPLSLPLTRGPPRAA